MNKTNIKTITIGVAIALVSFYSITFIDTLLGFAFGVQLRKPLGEYLLWGYTPLILSGIYIGISKAKMIILIGAIVAILSHIARWLIIDVLFPSPYFDHSFRSFPFGFGLIISIIICGTVAFITKDLRRIQARNT